MGMGGEDGLFQFIRMTQLDKSVRKAMFDEIGWQRVGSWQEPERRRRIFICQITPEICPLHLTHQ